MIEPSQFDCIITFVQASKVSIFLFFHGLLRIPVVLIYLMVKRVIFVWLMRFPNKMTSFRVFLCPRFHFSSVGLILCVSCKHYNAVALSFFFIFRAFPGRLSCAVSYFLQTKISSSFYSLQIPLVFINEIFQVLTKFRKVDVCPKKDQEVINRQLSFFNEIS